MKKIMITFICILMSVILLGIPAMSEGDFEIVSSSPADGDKNADISALITVTFSEEIGQVSAEEITCLPASVGEVEKDGKILKVRLVFQKEYNTEYTLDLSAVTSASGKSLKNKTIKFKTKEAVEGKIFEDDFETKTVDTAKWRAPKKGCGAVQKEGDNGNWSYQVVSGGSVDNYTNPLPYPFGIGHKAVLDFDIFIEDATANYNFFTVLGNNGLSGDDAKNFESYWTGLLTYNFEDKTFGVLYNQEFYKGGAGYPKNANAVVTAKDGWNSLRVVFDIEAQTLQLIVNGTEAKDESGNSEFKIPFSSQYGSAGQNLINVRIPATASAKLYFDNFSYRQLFDPTLESASVSNGETLQSTCPEIRMSFKNEVTALSLKLNGEDIAESCILKNTDGTYSVFPSLMWGESYTLDGVIEGIYGMEGSFTLDFNCAEQKGSLIESAGFYKGDARIFSIVPGEITAKLKFWQEESKTYAYLAAVYKKDGDRIEMISSVSYGEFTSEGNLSEKEVKVTVPEDTENCFVKVFVLTDTLTRIPYADSVLSGSMVLE